MDSSQIRKTLLAGGIPKAEVSQMITAINELVIQPKNNSLGHLFKKYHAQGRIVLGILVFVIGLILLVLQLTQHLAINYLKTTLILLFTGIGSYASGKYALRKITRPIKKFNSSLKPIDRNLFDL